MFFSAANELCQLQLKKGGKSFFFFFCRLTAFRLLRSCRFIGSTLKYALGKNYVTPVAASVRFSRGRQIFHPDKYYS